MLASKKIVKGRPEDYVKKKQRIKTPQKKTIEEVMFPLEKSSKAIRLKKKRDPQGKSVAESDQPFVKGYHTEIETVHIPSSVKGGQKESNKYNEYYEEEGGDGEKDRGQNDSAYETYKYFRIIYPFTSPEFILNKKIEMLNEMQKTGFEKLEKENESEVKNNKNCECGNNHDASCSACDVKYNLIIRIDLHLPRSLSKLAISCRILSGIKRNSTFPGGRNSTQATSRLIRICEARKVKVG